MSLGGLYLRLRQWSEHGMRVAWYRDVVRKRILHTRPITGLDDDTCELHVMTSKGDWLNLLWALKSFYDASRRRYRLCIHEDGSVPPEGIAHITRHFPDARLIRRVDADKRMAEALADFPLSLQFRNTNLLAPKVFDFVTYLTTDRMLLFDSDLLFYKEPTALLERIEDPDYKLNAFNADFGSAYTVTPETVREKMGFELQERVNSGLALIHRASMRWDWTEQFLQLPGLRDGHFWRIEQTLYALCASRYGVELLPDDYTLHLEPGFGDRPFRHYVGRIRHMMYGEGIAHLVRHGFLDRLRAVA